MVTGLQLQGRNIKGGRDDFHNRTGGYRNSSRGSMMTARVSLFVCDKN